MKTLKIMLLLVVLTTVGMLTGCKAGYVGKEGGTEPTKIYHQRADGLRIPSYGY